LRDNRGGSAAEFALVLPLFLLFLLGIIDAGRYAWEYNQAEKATQIGARWAVATDMVPSELVSYSFAVSCGVPQGTPITDSANFGGATCQSNATTATCSVATNCSGLGDTANNTAFGNLAARMGEIYPAIQRQNIVVDYANSGLGFSGDPNGPDVVPLVTVSLRDLNFQPMTLMLFNEQLDIPSASSTLTMEDGQGSDSN
jgi:hypothetical protein